MKRVHVSDIHYDDRGIEIRGKTIEGKSICIQLSPLNPSFVVNGEPYRPASLFYNIGPILSPEHRRGAESEELRLLAASFDARGAKITFGENKPAIVLRVDGSLVENLGFNVRTRPAAGEIIDGLNALGFKRSLSLTSAVDSIEGSRDSFRPDAVTSEGKLQGKTKIEVPNFALAFNKNGGVVNISCENLMLGNTYKISYSSEAEKKSAIQQIGAWVVASEKETVTALPSIVSEKQRSLGSAVLAGFTVRDPTERETATNFEEIFSKLPHCRILLLQEPLSYRMNRKDNSYLGSSLTDNNVLEIDSSNVHLFKGKRIETHVFADTVAVSFSLATDDPRIKRDTFNHIKEIKGLESLNIRDWSIDEDKERRQITLKGNFIFDGQASGANANYTATIPGVGTLTGITDVRGQIQHTSDGINFISNRPLSLDEVQQLTVASKGIAAAHLAFGLSPVKNIVLDDELGIEAKSSTTDPSTIFLGVQLLQLEQLTGGKGIVTLRHETIHSIDKLSGWKLSGGELTQEPRVLQTTKLGRKLLEDIAERNFIAGEFGIGHPKDNNFELYASLVDGLMESNASSLQKITAMSPMERVYYRQLLQEFEKNLADCSIVPKTAPIRRILASRISDLADRK